MAPYTSKSKINLNKIRSSRKSRLPKLNKINVNSSSHVGDASAANAINVETRKANKRSHQHHVEAKTTPNKNITISLDDYDEAGNFRGLAPKRRKIMIPANRIRSDGGIRKRPKRIVISPDDYDARGNYRGHASKRRKIEIDPKNLLNKMKLFRESVTLRRSSRIMNKNNSNLSSGKGLENDFIPYNSNIVYEYYDDPNELCDRLRLLVASKQAGNSNHDQEINSIVEELRESNYIE